LSDDIFASEILVAEYDGYDIDLLGNSNFSSDFGMMLRGPDDKIYNVAGGQGLGIHVIHNPNEKGIACNFEHRGIILPTYVYHTVPNHNTLRLGPIDGSSCDTLGIDNNPFARFRYEQDTIDMLDLDFVDLSYYRPESWQWDFGDGVTSSARHPSHKYGQSGIYNVCLTVSNENSSHTICDTLNLGISDVSKELFDFKITVFPNPVEDYCRIAFHNYIPNKALIKILDSQGQVVMQDDLEVRDQVIDLTTLHSGIYFYEVIDKGSVIKSGKLVKI